MPKHSCFSARLRFRVAAILAIGFIVPFLAAQTNRSGLVNLSELHSVATVIDSQNTVWNLTRNTLFQLRNGSWQQVGHDSVPDEPAVTNVTPLLGPEGGVFWITTKHASYHAIYAAYACLPDRAPFQVGSWTSLTGPAHTLSVKATNDGSVWIGGMDARLRHWSVHAPGEFKSITISDALFSSIPADHEVRFDAVWEPIRLLAHPNGQILFWSELSRRDQPSYLRHLSGVWMPNGNSFRRVGESIPDGTVQTAAMAAGGELWVATDKHGLWRVDADGNAQNEVTPTSTEIIQSLSPGENWVIAVTLPATSSVQRRVWFRRGGESWKALGELPGKINLPHSPVVQAGRWIMPLEHHLAVIETNSSAPSLRLLDWRNDWSPVRIGSAAASADGVWGAQILTPWSQLEKKHPSVRAEYLGQDGFRSAGRAGLWVSIDPGPTSSNRARLIRHWSGGVWREIPRPDAPEARHAGEFAAEENGTLWLYGNQISEVWTQSPDEFTWTKHKNWADAIDACGDRLIEFITPSSVWGSKPLVMREDRQAILMVSPSKRTVATRFNKTWRSWSFKELGIEQLPRRPRYGFETDGSPWIQTTESHRLVPDGRGGWRRIDRKQALVLPEEAPPGTDPEGWEKVRAGQVVIQNLQQDSQGVFWHFKNPSQLWFKSPDPASTWQRWHEENALVPWRGNMVFDEVGIAANGDRFMFGNSVVIMHDKRLPPPPAN